MKHKVEALDTYKRLKVKDNVIGKIVPAGYQFVVDDNRLKVLLGDNKFKVAFVRLVEGVKDEEVKEEVKEENAEVEEVKEIVEEKKPRKKTSKKK